MGVNAADEAFRLTSHQRNRAVEHLAARTKAAYVLLCQRNVDVGIVGDHGQIGNIL